MSEEMIIRHCSPTLAGIKTGNLFSCSYNSKKRMTEEVRKLNRKLVSKGLCIIPIYLSDERVLIYMYRPQKLRKDFSDKEVQKILEDRGYFCQNTALSIKKLIERIHHNSEFPHEIGLFLGYPAEDVRGFMERRPCCKCTGCWKVYGDEKAAQKLFDQYRKCTDIYCARWKRHEPLEQLAVIG